MCGIFGVVGSFYNGVKTLDLNLISHRGPDAKDFCDLKKNKVLLGHTRLAIIDINDRANQPMHSTCGRFIIIYNVFRIFSVGFTQLRDAVFAIVGQNALRLIALNAFRHIHSLSLNFHLMRKTS